MQTNLNRMGVRHDQEVQSTFRIGKEAMVAKHVARPLLVPLLMLFDLVCVGSRARAGDWKISYQPVGSSQGGSTTTPRKSDWSAQNNVSQGGRQGVSAFSDGSLYITAYPGTWAATTVKLSGHVKVLFDWVPASGDPSPTPPDKLTFKVTASNDETCVSYIEPPALTVKTGLSPEPAPTPSGYQYAENSGYMKYVRNSRSNGSQLVQLATNSQTHMEWDSGELGGSIALPEHTQTSYFQGQALNARIGATLEAAKDTRSVKLTRNGKDRFELKDGSWVTYGDSRFSYLERVLTTDPDPVTGYMGSMQSYKDDPHDVVQTIVQDKGLGWSSDKTKLKSKWTFSDSNVLSNTGDNAAVVTMPQGNSLNNPDGIETTVGTQAYLNAVPSGWYRVPSQGTKQFTVTHDLTDADGATATAKYVLSLHDEWEDAKPDPDKKRKVAGGQPDVEGETTTDWSYFTFGIPRSPNLTTGDKDASWSIDQSVKFSVKLAATFSPEFKIADWVNAGGSVESTLEPSISADFAATAPKPSTQFPGSPTGTRYQPIIAYYKRVVHKLLLRYNADGLWLNSDKLNFPEGDMRYGRWPQSKEEGPLEYLPCWLPIAGNETPVPSGTTGFLSKKES